MKALIGLFTFLAVLIMPLNAHSFSKKPTKPPPPVCFLSGEVNKTGATGGSFESLGNSIRLRFEAASGEECMAQFQAWCKTDVLAHRYVVGKLAGYFDHSGTRADFTINADCTVLRQYSQEK